MKHKNIFIENRYKIKLEKISFFMAENNSNKSMIIGGGYYSFLVYYFARSDNYN